MRGASFLPSSAPDVFIYKLPGRSKHAFLPPHRKGGSLKGLSGKAVALVPVQGHMPSLQKSCSSNSFLCDLGSLPVFKTGPQRERKTWAEGGGAKQAEEEEEASACATGALIEPNQQKGLGGSGMPLLSCNPPPLFSINVPVFRFGIFSPGLLLKSSLPPTFYYEHFQTCSKAETFFLGRLYAHHLNFTNDVLR